MNGLISSRLFMVLVLLCAGAAAAAGMVVVRTSDVKPYLLVEKAFREEVGQPIQALSLTPPGEARAAPEANVCSAVEGASFVLAIGPDAAREVSKARPTAPVLLALVPDGLRAVSSDVKARVVPMFVPPQRQARLIRTLLPGAKSVGVIYDPGQSKALVAEYDSAAASLGLELLRQEVTSKKEVANAVRALVGKVDALWLVPDATVIGQETFKFMVQQSMESKIPLIGFSSGMSRAGALLSVVAEYDEIGRKAALAARKGPGAPVEAPEGRVYLNGKTASLLGVQLPGVLRRQAAQIFE